MCTRIAILICTCACTGCDLLAGMRRSAQVGQPPRGVELARHRMRRVGVLFEPQALARRLAAQALQPQRRPAARLPAGPRRGRGRRRPPGAAPACPLHGCAAPADARRAASRPPSLNVRVCMLLLIFICGCMFGCALLSSSSRGETGSTSWPSTSTTSLFSGSNSMETRSAITVLRPGHAPLSAPPGRAMVARGPPQARRR